MTRKSPFDTFSSRRSILAFPQLLAQSSTILCMQKWALPRINWTKLIWITQDGCGNEIMNNEVPAACFKHADEMGNNESYYSGPTAIVTLVSNTALQPATKYLSPLRVQPPSPTYPTVHAAWLSDSHIIVQCLMHIAYN